jgi:two-component system sensor histidine kinase BaeS
MLSAFHRHLGIKLLAAHLVVITIGAVVLLTATELSVPPAFEHHMAAMGAMMGGSNMMETELYGNFRAAVNEALTLATVAALISAIVVSIFVSRQVATPVQAMMRASQRIAAGHYEERVSIPGNVERGDLDELARLALSFNQMAAQLARTEEMRSRLIADVAHELRTPLTTIKGTAEGLIDGVLSVEPQTFHQIYREADRLQRLVSDLQELSRVEAGAYPLNRQPTEVQRLIDTMTERLKRQFEEKGVALDVTLPSDLPLVLVDEDRIGQVLLNLVGNALQYTPESGTVTVMARRDHQEVAIAIRDTGIGIAAEHLSHLFTRFYRVDKSRSRAAGGNGIGLTIARHLVEAHGGSIRAESPGASQGSTFTFTLPIAP